MADVEVQADVLTELEDRIVVFHLRQVVGVVVEADPDLVLVRKRCHTRGEDGVALGGHASAAQRLGHEEAELDLLIRLPEAHLVDVNVDARVVIHLPQITALRELLLPLRVGGLALDAREVLDRSAHEFRLAEAVIEQCLQRLLRRLRHAAIAIRDAPDAHAIEDGVGLSCGRSEPWKRETSGGGEGSAEEMTARKRVGCHEMVNGETRRLLPESWKMKGWECLSFASLLRMPLLHRARP